MRRPLQWAALLVVVAIAAWLGWRHYERQWLNAPIAALGQPVTPAVVRSHELRLDRGDPQAQVVQRAPGVGE